MPSENTIKRYLPNTFYHVYNRSTNKMHLFPQDKDYTVYKRCLLRTLDKFDGEVKILSYVLLRNHFHLLLWQRNETNMTHFMRSLSVSYARYIMEKYNHFGPIYESRYKALPLQNKGDVERILTYIKKNPLESGYVNWPHRGGEWKYIKKLQSGWENPLSYKHTFRDGSGTDLPDLSGTPGRS